MTTGTQGDDRLGAMERLLALQQETLAAMPALMSVDGEVAPEAFEEYLALARRLLADVSEFERSWPGSFDLQPYAEPLVQQLSIFADYREASGDRDGATRLRAEADALTASHLDAVAAAGVRRNRAMEAATAGRFSEALVGLDEAHQTYLAADDPTDAAQTLVQLANVYEWLCDYDRALTTLESAHALVAPRLAGGPPSAGSIALGFGRQLLSIARGDSTSEGQDALELRRVHSEILQGRARVNRRLGHFDVALQLLEEVRPFVPAFVRGGLDFHVAAAAIGTGDLDRAEQLLTSIEPSFAGTLMRPRRAALRQLQADVLLARHRDTDALAAADDGLADQAAYPDLDLAWKLQWRRAKALSALGRADEAGAAYRASAQAADTLRMAPLGYALDTSFVTDKLPMFEDAIDDAVARGDGESALWFIELVKARALSTILSRPRAPEPASQEDEARFDEFSLRLDAIAFSMYSGSATAADVQERQRLLSERTDALERIRIRDPRWRGLTEPPPVDVAAISARLGEQGRAALVLFQRDDRVVSALLDSHGVRVGTTTCSAETMNGVAEYVDNLRRAQPDWFLADISTELGVTLTDLVPEDIATTAASASTLLVVPHGTLHLLPWATMTVAGRRLLETTAVGVLPNLSALTLLDGDLSPKPSVTLFGDPDYSGLQRYQSLPQAGPELADLEAVYGAEGLLSPPKRGVAATEAALVALLDQPGAAKAILHVACHADLEADEPLTSGLILTQSKLDAAELVGERCGHPEVVLSACSTGWRPQSVHGTALAGDDALGLVASFLEAGARSVLVSITQAKDDVARTFSVRWHRLRRSGLEPLAAYRATQLEMLADDPSAVWSWAGFTVYGCR